MSAHPSSSFFKRMDFGRPGDNQAKIGRFLKGGERPTKERRLIAPEDLPRAKKFCADGFVRTQASDENREDVIRARKFVADGHARTQAASNEVVVLNDSEKEKASESRSKPTSLPMKPIARPLNDCEGMSFDFGADPKLSTVQKTLISLVNPECKETDQSNLREYMSTTTKRCVEEMAGKKSAASSNTWKGGKRTGAPSTASVHDFRTGSGAPVVKDVKKVFNENNISDGSQSDAGTSSDRYLGSKRIPRNGFRPPERTPSVDMRSVGSSLLSSSANKPGPSGLAAEPSLKHLDQNVIATIESEIMLLNDNTTWDDVSGLEGAKKNLREIVVLPFLRPEIFKGIRAPPKGVLLFGPPGTGKTMIGRCVASQCRATFFNISASSLTSKWVGEGEKLVRALFAVARLKLPSVIFIDEVDSLLSSRSDSEHESSRRIKTEFLVQMDGVATNKDERLLVLGATNRPQELDEAARRRFAKRLYIALPQKEARVDIVRRLLGQMKNDIGEEEYDEIGTLTEGYSGADMRQLCTEASMGPIRDIDNSTTMDIETVDADEIRAIALVDFREAIKVVRPSVADEDLNSYKAWDTKFGCLS